MGFQWKPYKSLRRAFSAEAIGKASLCKSNDPKLMGITAPSDWRQLADLVAERVVYQIDLPNVFASHFEAWTASVKDTLKESLKE